MAHSHAHAHPHSYKIELAYRGTHYLGWQYQPQGKTIQGEINRALEKLAKSSHLHTLASGRTDAGVHAFGQIFRANLPIKISPEGLARGLNSLLPAEIRIIKAEKCPNSFHPVRDAKWKEYIYYFTTASLKFPFLSDLIEVHSRPLNIELMQKGAPLFVGEHDFCNYYCEGTHVKSTVRTIYHCELSRQKFDFPSSFLPSFLSPLCPPPIYVLEVRGSGFLKQMVRLMVGALWQLGTGELSETQLLNSLKSSRGNNGSPFPVAPAKGLYLRKVCY